MAEKIILEVDVAGLANDIQTARVALDSYRIALERSVEENGKFSKEATIAKAQFDAQSKAVKQLEGQLLRVTQAQQANNALLKDLVKQGYDPANKSIDQNRKVLNALTAEYNRASKEGRDKLAPTIKQISDELKKQEGAIGDTRRNVGNYKEAITQAFGELKGFGGQLVQVGQSIGGSINAFKAAEGGVKGFGAALATTGLPLFITAINLLISAFESFKPVADAIEQAMGGLAFAFGSGYEAGVQLTKAVQDLEDAQREAIVTNALYAKSINELEAQAANKAAKDEDRIKALKEANNIRLQQLKDEKRIAQEQLKIAESEVKNSEARNRQIASSLYAWTLGVVQTTAEASDDVLQKQQEARARLIQLDDQFNQATIANQNKIDLLTKQLEEDRKKRNDERVKNAQETAQKINEANKLVVDTANDLIQEQQRLDAIDEAIAKRKADRYVKDYTDRRKALEQLQLNNQLELELQIQFNQSQEEIDKEFAESSFNTFKEYYDNKKKLYEEDAKNRQKADEQILAGERAKVQAANIAANSIINTIQLVGEAAGAGAKFQKAVAFAQVLVNQALAIANAVVGATSSGASTGPAAIVTTPTFIATLISSVLAVFGSVVTLFGKADVPSSPKFADGGEVTVGGKLHSEGGTKYVGEDGNRFEVERGEKIFVLNRKASRHIDALGGLNMAFGGRSWSDSPIRYAADGGMIQDGGFGIRQTSEQANTTAMLKQFAKSIVSEMPTPVVSVVEFERVQSDRNKSISVAEL